MFTCTAGGGVNLVPGALAPVFDHLQYAEVEREGRSHHVQYDVNSTQGRHVGNSAQQFTNFTLISIKCTKRRAVLILLFKCSSLCSKKGLKILCWSLPFVCVYLSLHHIAAHDAISARGSPTSSLQTTSDQNLGGGKAWEQGVGKITNWGGNLFQVTT